jgi:hypothetical protein
MENSQEKAKELQSQWLVPDYPVLRGEVGQAAIDGQILYYPKVTRSMRDEPIETQTRGLVSFMFLKEPRQTTTGKNLYGFFKLRGNWADENQATARASRIVTEQDSKYPIRVAHVGEWLPLTDDDSLAKKNVKVNVDETKEQKDLREAASQEEEKRKRIMRELKEREDEIKNAKDYNDDKEDIDFYTMKMVVWLRLQETIELEKRKIVDLEGKLLETRKLLHKLDDTHPEFNELWIENYNRERRKAGIPDYVPGNMELKTYLEYTPPAEETLPTEETPAVEGKGKEEDE